MLIMQFKKLHPAAIIPTRGTEHAAGFDLYALEETPIKGGEGNVLVPTGIAVQMPPGTYGRIAMRSGLAVREHLAVSAGVIDIDYTGPIGVVVFSTKIGGEFLIKRGERFAQLVPEMICCGAGREVEQFEVTYGKHEGFGSTGL